MSEPAQRGLLHPSSGLYQGNTDQSPAQCYQPLQSITSPDTTDSMPRHDLSPNSLSSNDYEKSGPLRVVNTNIDPSPAISTSTASSPETSNESSSKASTSFEDDEADTSSIKEQVPDNQTSTHKHPSIRITDTTRTASHPFRRFFGTIGRNNSRPKGALSPRQERWSLDDFDEIEKTEPNEKNTSRHRKSSSWSSRGLVGAVRSATASLVSLSVPHQSRKQGGTIFARKRYRSSNRSSWLNNSGNRGSMDSNRGPAPTIDNAAWERALQRRRTLEELISSEEGYVSDLKVLVYFTLIASASSGSLQLFSQTRYNLTEILKLHEYILYYIRRTVSDSDIRSDNEMASRSESPKSIEWNSPGSPRTLNTPSHADRWSLEVAVSGRPTRGVLLSDPGEVTEVAKIFTRLMSRFFIYEEYSAKYESMILEMTSASKTIPNWHIYERGIESLANSLASTGTQSMYSKKGLSFEDLLIKPMQRICKYPLLFADLYKYTPVIDGPDSRVELEKALCGLKEMVKGINKATNDQDTRERIKRSRHLQDLLVLPETSEAPMSLRLLRHATLCGILFVAYQCGRDDVRGEYMLCALFDSYLLLATPKSETTKFDVVAIISLKDIQIEKSEGGRGLQCYTAPYSWKLIFGAHQKLYELIFCACSPREEEQWQSSLSKHSMKEGQTQPEDCSTILTLDIRPLSYVLGPPGTLIRRLSIQRAATVSSRSNVCQVIITNTNALKDHCNKENSCSIPISRSQSLLMGNRILVLAPKRAERIRLECILADVWTRDLLPYPGMSPNRGEHLIRTSASSMMRKLSRASKSSSLKKRSGSHTAFESDQILAHHTSSESSIPDDTYERPATYFRSFKRNLPKITAESEPGSSSVESPSKKSPTKVFGSFKKNAGRNRQGLKIERTRTLNLSLSNRGSSKRGNSDKLL